MPPEKNNGAEAPGRHYFVLQSKGDMVQRGDIGRKKGEKGLSPPSGAALTYMSLFSGAGVGCHGLAAEKFECVATVEIIPRRLEIQRVNRKCRLDSGYICGDMDAPATQQQVESEARKWGVDTPGGLDFLIATPPCQGMSVCNHKKGDEARRNSLVVSAIEAAARYRPKVFLFENTALFLRTPCALPDGREAAIGEGINELLGEWYHILPRRVNLKNYGCPSSRTRTLVIGVDKRFWFSPLSIFPDWTPEATLREIIGDLPPLAKMGEIADGDIYHSFKPYAAHMRGWIKGLREGQSAFERKSPRRIPHRIVNGRRVENKNANGDKYRRQRWGAVPPCVHTRNDILASQNTVHPKDDRVFSVREVMRMMSVPPNFRWAETSGKHLSELPEAEKRQFLRTNEMNIRHSLGEAVPPAVVRNIAAKVKACLKESPKIRHRAAAAAGKAHLAKAALFSQKGESAESLMCAVELSNEKREEHAAFYTPPATSFKLLQMLPDLRPKAKIRILEPSAGIGRILHFLPTLLSHHDEVHIDAMDIDPRALEIARTIAARVASPDKVKINYLCGDFLEYPFANADYDLIVGNPPFGKMPTAKMRHYAATVPGVGSGNIFAFFMARALKLARHVVMIAPKSVLGAPEFGRLRAGINAKHTVRGICDFGEKGFDGVRIETVALSVETGRKQKSGDAVAVESVPMNVRSLQRADKIFDGGLPYWVIYRDEHFDRMLDGMKLGVFSVFRDRQICKRHFCKTGGTRVIKSRNIESLRARKTDGDVFIRDASAFAASRFINRRDVLLTPNLTLNPRACRMPKDRIADGSVAVLYPSNGIGRLDNEDVEFFASDDFRGFYRTARNHGTRTLNVDANSVQFFGVRR